MSTTGDNLKYEIAKNSDADFPLTESHFDLERKCFKHIKQCPASFEESVSFYRPKDFIVCSCFMRNTLIGFKLLEKIKDNQYHSLITVVDAPFRKLGIAKEMSRRIRNKIAGLKTKYLTKFCLPETWTIDIEDEGYELLCSSDHLTDQEKTLLSNIARKRGKPDEFLHSRIQLRYYEYTDGRFGDAMFKCYKISKFVNN